MTRPWRIWLVFSLCGLIVLVAMAWISSMALRLEDSEAEKDAERIHEENIRLALWRMDSSFAPVVIEESSRPFFTYRSFYVAGRAYDAMYSQIRGGQVLVPSPLLTLEAEPILLHFQIEPEGVVTSPQAPRGNMRDLAEAEYTTAEKINAATARLARLRRLFNEDALVAEFDQQETDGPVEVDSAARATPGSGPRERLSPGQQTSGQEVDPSSQQQSDLGQSERGSNEYWARKRNIDKLTSQQSLVWDNVVCNSIPPLSKVSGSGMRPLWIGGELFLARRVVVNRETYFQGCWLDWEKLRQSFITEIHDLLPGARLEPAGDSPADKPTRLLAALPVELHPGEAPDHDVGAIWSIRFPLIIAWVGMAVAVLAVGVLLRGVVSLSERRGAFVSAVTHELRTPLTTFQMYTEMLAERMVTDERRRRRYLDTLRREADRLGHMVENVLAYARLENGRDPGRCEPVPLRELTDRVRPRLEDRAEQAGKELALELSGTDPDTRVKADASTVEQILLNLVDNACKYGGPSSNGAISLAARRTADAVVIEVADRGPGISAELRGRLFTPFCKSARQAATSAPGVGLGLALSRRLARAMGGDLRLEEREGYGAIFALRLPAV